MRRQEGSSGWRVAQVREVIRGCAGELSGAILVRDGGRVCEFGKRMGEMNGLENRWVSEDWSRMRMGRTGN